MRRARLTLAATLMIAAASCTSAPPRAKAEPPATSREKTSAAPASAPAMAPAPPPPKTRARVRSTKRGVCANKLSPGDFAALQPGVSWWYSWHWRGETAPGIDMDFYPMVWGGTPNNVRDLEGWLQDGNKAPHVMVLNEPNLKGQAFITPEQSAEQWRRVANAVAPYGCGLAGPHMAMGAAAKDSITAFDPLQNKEVTYTWMVPYLDAFYHFAGDTKDAPVAVHSYKNAGEAKWICAELHRKYGRKVWMTEFAMWNAADMDAMIDYMIDVVDFYERSPFVEKYAWFKAHMGDDNKMSLLHDESGKLTPLGEAYVNMPVHRPDAFYSVPGRAQVESYVALQSCGVKRTADADGFLDVLFHEADGWVEYNIDAAKAGTYAARLRVAGAAGAKITITRGDAELGTMEVTSGATSYATIDGTVTLLAGEQTLRIRSSREDVRINWIDFTAR